MLNIRFKLKLFKKVKIHMEMIRKKCLNDKYYLAFAWRNAEYNAKNILVSQNSFPNNIKTDQNEERIFSAIYLYSNLWINFIFEFHRQNVSHIVIVVSNRHTNRAKKHRTNPQQNPSSIRNVLPENEKTSPHRL